MVTTTERYAERAHLFQELADLSTGEARTRYAHKSHISYLAMVRVARRDKS